MAQNQAHIGDTVSPIYGEFAGKQGKIIALGSLTNRCMIRIPKDANPVDEYTYEYIGSELKLIECYHMGINTGE